jgi:CheY-like chemotaxis protein
MEPATRTVLCVHDRPQVLELRRALLESRDYCVRIASSGYAALKILKDTPVAVVLLEYNPEGIDAEAVALHIKQRFPGLPIVLLSGHSEMPARILRLVDEYAMKSRMPEGLVRIIEKVRRTPPGTFRAQLGEASTARQQCNFLRNHRSRTLTQLPHAVAGGKCRIRRMSQANSVIT